MGANNVKKGPISYLILIIICYFALPGKYCELQGLAGCRAEIDAAQYGTELVQLSATC